LREQRESGLGIKEYCAKFGLNSASLCTWRRRYEAGGVDGLKARPAGRAHRTTNPDEKRRTIEAYLKSELPGWAFARTWGVAMSTLLRWLKRYREAGPQGLERTTTPGAPKGRPRLPAELAAEIEATKRRFPDFGLRKVRDFLRRFRALKVSAGGVRAVLDRAGIAPTATPRKRTRSADRIRRFERAAPRELWQSDITSYVIGRTRERAYLTVFLDDHSRYIVSFALNYHQRQDLVIEAFRDGSAKFGKPQEVLTDQGRQYFAWRGRSDFQKLLEREGVKHVVSRAHHPETLGKCERLWETIDREFWSRAQPRDLADARERLARWIGFYNHFRPHQSLGGMTPADRFFGVEEAVRRAQEAAVTKNDLRLALDEPLRKPVYLVGQIDGKSVSLHGESGRIVVRTPDGATQVLETEAAGGATKATKATNTTNTTRSDHEERNDGAERHGSGDHDGGAGRGTPAAVRGADAADAPQRARGTAAVPGAGPVGGGDGGGADEGEDDGDGAARVLDGAAVEGRDGGGAAGDPGPGVAALAAGAVRDARGPAEAAADAGPDPARGDRRDAGRDDGPRGGVDAVEEGPGAGAASDRGPEGDAGVGGEGCGSAVTGAEGSGEERRGGAGGNAGGLRDATPCAGKGEPGSTEERRNGSAPHSGGRSG
jgi:transposase InsO family protein